MERGCCVNSIQGLGESLFRAFPEAFHLLLHFPMCTFSFLFSTICLTISPLPWFFNRTQTSWKYKQQEFASKGTAYLEMRHYLETQSEKAFGHIRNFPEDRMSKQLDPAVGLPSHSFGQIHTEVQESSTKPLSSALPTPQSAQAGILHPQDEDSNFKDTFLVLLSLSLLCVVLYFVHQIWKKRRKRSWSIAKMEDYRYSRLSQNEIEVDGLQFSNPLLDQEDSTLGSDNDESSNGPAPATLHLDADTTLINHETNPSSIMAELSDEDLIIP